MTHVHAGADATGAPDRFDPQEWAAVQDGARSVAATLLFRRGRELACDAVVARWPVGTRAVWLDLGCGTGHLLRDLAARDRRAAGADHDPAMLRFARAEILPDAAIPLLGADATRLPLRDGALDGVVAVSLLGCIANADALLREVARVLRPGGCLVVTLTSRSSLLRRVEHLAARATRRRGTAPPFRAYGLRETSRLLARAGLVVEARAGYGFHLQTGERTLPGEAASRSLERLLPGALGAGLARNVLLVARRS